MRERSLIDEGDTCDRRREWAVHIELSQVQLQHSIGDFLFFQSCRLLREMVEATSRQIPSSASRVRQRLSWTTPRSSFHHTNQDAAQHLGPATAVVKLDERTSWGENLRHPTKGHHKCTDSFALTQGCAALKGSKTSPIGCYWVCTRPENVWLSGCPKEGFRPETTSKLKLHHSSHDGHHQAKLYTDAEVSTWKFVCQLSAVSNMGIILIWVSSPWFTKDMPISHTCTQCIGMQDP